MFKSRVPLLALPLASLALLGCPEDGEGGTNTQTYPAATCQESCAKTVALACPFEAFTDVDTCVTQCENQIADCDNQDIIDQYLGCAVATEMACGDSSGTATSAECVGQGLTFFACTQGMDLTDVGFGDDVGTDTN